MFICRDRRKAKNEKMAVFQTEGKTWYDDPPSKYKCDLK